MYAVNTYEEIEKNERLLNERHIIVLLFVRPSLEGAEAVIKEFDYLHYNSNGYCSIYAVGYTNNPDIVDRRYCQLVNGVNNSQWYFSSRAFVEFKNNLESRLKWRYSGEIELLVLQSNPEGRQILNFQNYVAIDVNYGIRKEYIDSFPRFMESLIRGSRSEVTAVEAMQAVKRRRYSIKEIVRQSVEECKKIPAPVKDICRDQLFFLSAKSGSAWEFLDSHRGFW